MVNVIKMLNLTIPESYFLDQYPWRYEHFTSFYITKKQIKYLFLHQFCLDSYETNTIEFGNSFPLKRHCDYIIIASLT